MKNTELGQIGEIKTTVEVAQSPLWLLLGKTATVLQQSSRGLLSVKGRIEEDETKSYYTAIMTTADSSWTVCFHKRTVDFVDLEKNRIVLKATA